MSAHIRRMTAADLSMVLKWRNHPQVRQAMYTQHRIGESEHRQWFAQAEQDVSRSLLIFESNEQPLGFVQFHSQQKGQAIWGFYLAPDAPRGTGHELGQCALQYAFSEAGFCCLLAEVLCDNEASLRFHRRLGFVEQGTKQVAEHNVVCFCITAEQWQKGVNDEP